MQSLFLENPSLQRLLDSGSGQFSKVVNMDHVSIAVGALHHVGDSLYKRFLATVMVKDLKAANVGSTVEALAHIFPFDGRNDVSCCCFREGDALYW